MRHGGPWLDIVFHKGYIPGVEWDVEYTEKFESWWNHLTEAEQIDVNEKVILLQQYGPGLPRP
jgi:hypothetical protein